MRKGTFLGCFLSMLFFLGGCGGVPTATPSPPATSTPTPTPTPDPVEERLAAMTTEEKVGQLLTVGLEGTEAGEEGEALLEELSPGGVIFFARNVGSGEQLATLTNDLKAYNKGKVPLFLAVDQEGGKVERIPYGGSRLPDPYEIGTKGEPSLWRDFGNTLGSQCAAMGCNVDFAPVLDIWSNPENTVIGRRAFGREAGVVSAAGTAVWKGILEKGVLPVVKHFPGHGDTREDSHVELPVVDRTMEELADRELIPFREAMEQGVPAVMVGHLLMTHLDHERPATLSPLVVNGLLRAELGFRGVVFTDDLTMGAVSKRWSVGEAAVLAVEAGCDQLLVCHGRENAVAARDALLAAVESGRLSMSRLEESVRRILALKETLGLTDAPVPMPDMEGLAAQAGELRAAVGR